MARKKWLAKVALIGLLFPCGTVSAASPKGRVTGKVILQPHAQANQDTPTDTTGKTKGFFTVRQWDGDLSVEAVLMYLEGDPHTVSLILTITNQAHEIPPPPSELFIPSTILAFLPNGHTYRPYNQVDVLQAAYAAENARTANAYSGYNPPPVTSYDMNCSLNASAASCKTTADQSAQVGYAVGYALGTAVRTALEKQKAEKYIQQVQKTYLISQEIPLGTTVIGYVDFYVEDVHSGPFTFRIPAGNKAYDFVFGPETSVVQFTN